MAIDINLYRKELKDIADIDKFSPTSASRESRYKGAAWELLTLLQESYQILEGLTPGGSEFYSDPRRCAEYIRQRHGLEHEMLVNWKKEANRLEAEIDRLKAQGAGE